MVSKGQQSPGAPIHRICPGHGGGGREGGTGNNEMIYSSENDLLTATGVAASVV